MRSAITITTLCFFLIEGLVDIDIFSWNNLLCRYVELGCVARVEDLFLDRSLLESRHFQMSFLLEAMGKSLLDIRYVHCAFIANL